MTLRLVIESSPGPQAVTERLFDGGQLSIGRGDDADWQLADPNAFVSRRHCILSEEDGRVMVTDASSGGLFIDNAANPVGAGNSVPIEPGMRLHLGDFTLRIESARATAGTAAPNPRAAASGRFFADEPAGPPPEPAAPRPENLPDPFGLRSDGKAGDRHKEVARPPRPLEQTDPFGLDLRRSFDSGPDPDPASEPARPTGGRGYFDAAAPEPPEPSGRPASAALPSAQKPERKKDIFDSWTADSDDDAGTDTGTDAAPPDAMPRDESRPRPRDDDPPVPPQPVDQGGFRSPFGSDLPPAAEPDPAPRRDPVTAGPQSPAASPASDSFVSPSDPSVPGPASTGLPASAPPPPDPVSPERPSPPGPAPGDDLRDALLRGMGLDPASVPRAEDPRAEMAHLGGVMHDLVEGVMLLLRTRAQEKQKVRVAQTIIASADVNPLKFLATPEDALAALVRPRGRGYLPPEQAVPSAFRDLADHQVRTWSALQIALRRMVDKFDPAEIEKEMADVGLLESLVAGGRKAKLWQIYEDRYRDIAQSAERQFLGDVGVDFRDAYENRGNWKDET